MINYNYLINKTILTYSTRGMDKLNEYLPNNFCEQAARDIINCPKGVVFIITGFYVSGKNETDGPLGAMFIYEALKKLEYSPMIITDDLCDNFFDLIPELDLISYPIEEKINKNGIRSILKKYNPVCLISIERCGRNKHNKYCNMLGLDIGKFTVNFDDFFLQKKSNVLSIGIGDGGNEIGMGVVKKNIEENLHISPCTVSTDHLIISTTSNWGAYGLITSLSIISEKNLLPENKKILIYLKHIVNCGAIDGIHKTNSLSVDGFHVKYDIKVISKLRKIIERTSYKYLRMDSNYENTSSSQEEIGDELIHQAALYLKNNKILKGELLDIGCSTGKITGKLSSKIDNKKIKITGIDIDENSINIAKMNYKLISFKIKDMFKLKYVNKYDIVFSNETLHWQPINNCIKTHYNFSYYFLEKSQKDLYITLSKRNFEYLLKNIYTSLKDNGVAFIGFGLDGQLKHLYKLLNLILKKYFPDSNINNVFPIYYPEKKYVHEVLKKIGFKVISFEIIDSNLKEESINDIVNFIKGFANDFFLEILGKEKSEYFFTLLEKEISKNEIFKKVRLNQWRHCVLNLRKNN